MTASHSSTKASDLEGEGEDQGAAGGVMAPVTSGRFFVRCISLSMSRSTTMLMALAPPAASAPPTRVATISHSGRQAALGHDHGGQRGDQQQLDDPRLGQGDVGPHRLPRPPRSPAREGGRLDGHVASAYGTGTRPGPGERPRYAWPECRDRRTPTVSPSLSHRLNVLALVLTALIVVTGGAVRLTGSGLGCSDWPDCSAGHLTPAVQFHSLVEFGNRLVTVVTGHRGRRRLPRRRSSASRAGATSSG